jgi:hypothetical protein
MMKFKIILVILLLVQFNLNAQWYNRHHGVDDPYLLTNEQLDFSQGKASTNIIVGILLDVVGGGILIKGIDIMNNTLDDDYYLGYLVSAFTGIFSVGLGAAVLIPGTILIIIGSNMYSTIRKVRATKFGNNEAIGLNPVLLKVLNNKYVAGVGITLRF